MLESANVGEWKFSDFMEDTIGHERRFGYLYDSSVPYAIPESDYENISNDNPFGFSNGFNKNYTWFTQHSAIDTRTTAVVHIIKETIISLSTLIYQLII